MSKLYHADIYIPHENTQICFNGDLQYSRHAEYAAWTDRYGQINNLPKAIHNGKADNLKITLIEVEVDDAGSSIKQVLRVPYDNKFDLILVVTSTGIVKTVWLNRRNDAHRTLKKHLYQPKPAKTTC